MIKLKNKKELRDIRHKRLRKNLSGTSERRRLAVFISLKNIYVQIIDDTKGITLVAASTKEKEIVDKFCGKKNIEAAKAVGTLIGKKALEKGIKEVSFDRGGFAYHGKVKALAESAREAGLNF